MRWRLWLGLVLFGMPTVLSAQEPPKFFKAGAYAMDITPTKFPVLVNGGFLEAKASGAVDQLHARCLILDDGKTRLAIVVVDSCMMERDFLDAVKKEAQETIGVPAERILISATHTHTAPSMMRALGSRADPEYHKFLGPQIVRGLHLASKNLQPARVGWAVIQDAEHTNCRRWIYRPDRMLTDPFGNKSVRANMHPGHQNPNAIGPSGPVDTGLSVLSIQTPAGQPLALLANYSQHYYGSAPVSADYYGRFCDNLEKRLGQGRQPAFMAVMSQGTSGDLMWMNYGAPAVKRDINAYAAAVADVAFKAYQNIHYHDWVPLGMKEAKLKLQRRLPDEKRLEWARKIDAAMEGRIPKDRTEVYAREALYIHANPSAELILQAVRIGDLGITAIPDEVYSITGLKLKAQSPLQPTFNVELANGSEGYIPPPEQHNLGGYTTWPAKTAGLEVQAEPKIVETLLTLLEDISGKKRLVPRDGEGAYTKAVLASKPAAFWRCGEFDARQALDVSGHQRHGVYEPGLAFYLEGPQGQAFAGDTINRAVHFAGGRMQAKVQVGKTYSVEGWLWNGLPVDARAVTGYLFSQGPEGDKDAPGDHLGLGGSKLGQGKLLFFNGNTANQTLTGKTDIQLKTWYHVVLVRDGRKATVYLNGVPEIQGEAEATVPAGCDNVVVGGRCDKFATWEGKLDEFAIYDRALSAEEVAKHYRASGKDSPKSSERGAKENPSSLPTHSPLPALQSQPLFRLPPGLRIELVAAEPDVQSPVAMTFDEDGRLYVVEMLDYPYPEKGKPPAGRIRLLEDRDGSGRYKATSVFADGLLFGNGVMPWKGGLIATSAPHILYLKDSDGDGQADLRQKLYEGFATENPQLRVSHPNLGLDNWIYVANGLRGGKVKASDRPGEVVNIGGRDFRFDLINRREEAITGMGQYGNTFDDWGNRFVCSNRNHWVHMVLPEHYIRRNPYLAVPPPHRDNQGPGGAAKIYPLTKQEATYYEHFGSFTAACGVFVYRGQLLPEAYRGCIFTCEPTGNLVHQEILFPKGVTFTGKAPRPGIEFLATTDDWCRPVFLTQGPDGALYVCDMYRRVIEHPEWMPKELRNRSDVNLGKDMGRIWRIVPEDYQPGKARPQLSKAGTPQLVELLAHPDSWWRLTAQRLLLERQDPAATEMLARVVVSSPSPLARVHAAWLLDKRGQMEEKLVLALLQHEQPRVREQGVRLAEPWLAKAPAVQQKVLGLARDADVRLRFQVALSLGAWDQSDIVPALAHIAREAADDSLTRLAVASAVPNRPGALLGHLLANGPVRLSMLQELAVLVGSRQDQKEVLEAIGQTLALAGPNASASQLAIRRGLAEGLQRRGSSLSAFFARLGLADSDLARRFDRLLDQTLALAQDASQPAARRADAIAQLAHLDWKAAGSVLGSLVRREKEPELQVAAVRALASFGQPEAAAMLVQAWSNLPQGAKREAVEAMLSQPERTLVLLKEMEAGKIAAADLDAARRLQLLNHRRSDVRTRARNLLAGTGTVERKKVLDAFRPALKMAGDPLRGRAVFQKATCASCHKLAGVGVDVGPPLADVRSRTPEAILSDILDPNAAIDANFVNYLVTLKNGKTLTGLLAAETASSLTLRRGDQQSDVVLRQDLDDLISTGKSLMPEDVDKQISLQDMADLLAFLRRWPEVQSAQLGKE